MKKKCLKKIGAKKSQVSGNPRHAKNLEFFIFKIIFCGFCEQSFFNILFSLFCDCLKVIRFRQVFMTFSSFFGRKCCKTQEIDENDAPLPHPRYLCRRSCKGAITTKTRDLSFHFTSFIYFISFHLISLRLIH